MRKAARLDRAYQNFFRRVKKKETPAGFPRFKSLDRYHGWGYPTHGDGWKLLAGKGFAPGQIRISGIGHIKIRGGSQVQGIPKTCEIVRKGDRWYASVTLKCITSRQGGTKAIGLDWGIENFATIVDHYGETQIIPNPRHTKKSLKALKACQQSVARKTKGSQNRRKAIRQLAALHRKTGYQRKNFLHQTTAKLVKESGLIATEQINFKNLTRSGGLKKRALNREILSTSPSTFFSLLRYKAEEAGIEVREALAKQLKPSQTCYRCGKQEKKLLSQRKHVCSCGAKCTRDENSARVLVNWALHGHATGLERASCGEPSAGQSRRRLVKLSSMKQESFTKTAAV
jgi:putative transposase